MSCTQFSVLLLRPDVSNVINTSRCPSLSVCFSLPHPLSVFCSLGSRILSGDWQPDCVFESPSNCQWVFIPLILYSYQFVNVSFLRSLFYLHFHFAFQSLQVKDAVFSASFSNDQMRQLYRFYITVDCSKSFISFAYDKDFFTHFLWTFDRQNIMYISLLEEESRIPLPYANHSQLTCWKKSKHKKGRENKIKVQLSQFTSLHIFTLLYFFYRFFRPYFYGKELFIYTHKKEATCYRMKSLWIFFCPLQNQAALYCLMDFQATKSFGDSIWCKAKLEKEPLFYIF